MPALTAQQEETLFFIISYFTAKHRMPTIREIMAGLGLKSPCPVQDRLNNLKAKGFIDWSKGKNRSLRLVGYRVQLIREEDAPVSAPEPKPDRRASVKYRAALALRDRGYNNSEIASELGITKYAVDKLLRAKEAA